MADFIKRSFSLVAIIGVISLMDSTFAAETPTSAGEYILKESFESGKRSPTGWREGAAVPGVEYIWSETVASHGKRSLGLKKTENRFFPIAQWFRSVPYDGDHANVEVCLKAKALEASKTIIDVQFYGDGNDMIGHEWLAYLGAKEEGDKPADHDWGRYGGVVRIPPGTKKLGFALQIYGPGVIWIDELTARYIGAASGDSTGAATVSPGESSASTAEAKVEGHDQQAIEGAVTVNVKGDATGQYFFHPAAADPAGLLVILPGGAGSADFHPFIESIHASALDGKFAVAQPLAFKWRSSQQIVWPTLHNRVPGMKFATEEFIAAVVKDAAAKQSFDPQQVYLLGWSSGGPACYATMLQKESPATGAFIAMSVFKPKSLPAIKNAAGRSFYLYHSPDDQVCPYWMATAAADALKTGGAKLSFVDYAGGHGWHGDMLGGIRQGVDWLTQSRDAK